MKKVLLVIFTFLFLSVFAYAEELKIGYVDIEKVFNQYSGTKAAKEKLKKDVEKEQKALEQEKEAIKKELDELDKKSSIMDKKQLSAKKEELQKKAEQLQMKTLDVQQKLLTREKELTSNIIDEIRAIIAKIGKEKKYDYIFEKTMLLYGGEDITYLVIKAINEQ
ncbi:MAG: OmpH family outer membrane protein [Candidatus Goldbacteria bacterium]|nr:OmpH family outer membrane protein [Candidatus Goldiibacteriota bacterium]